MSEISTRNRAKPKQKKEQKKKKKTNVSSIPLYKHTFQIDIIQANGTKLIKVKKHMKSILGFKSKFKHITARHCTKEFLLYH